MHSITTAFIALGSNLGDRIEHLRYAVRSLREDARVHVVKVSPVYESPAHTLTPGEVQPAYLNAVVAVETALDPAEMLQLCHEIERGSGRVRSESGRWKPRTLDLDLLIFGDTTLRTGDVTVPHPRLSDRAFVLRPLADIAPDLEIPSPISATVRELLRACPDSGETVRTDFLL